MKAILVLCVLAMLCGCQRYPSKLPASEQIQALIFEDLGVKLFDKSGMGNSAYPFFLCYGDPLGDPSPAVLAYVTRSFKSARLCSMAERPRFGMPKERATGREGVDLIIAPFTNEGEGPLVLQAEVRVGKGGAAYEYQVERVKGRWKIVKQEKKWSY